MALTGSLILVGCGKMGGAMLNGWLARGIPAARLIVVEPNPTGLATAGASGVQILADLAALEGMPSPEVVVVAVKPQTLPDLAPKLRPFAAPGTVFLSVAAGKTIAYFHAHLSNEAALVRAMPNTPAAVGRGITAVFADPRVSAGQRALCQELLEAVGEVAWVDDEGLLDAVTAVSGGGPAYVFLLMETLAEAGIAAGLPADLARRLARATVEGSGELSRLTPELAPATLRQNVMSPGGTTEQAVKVLRAANGLQPLMTRAIAAATRRSRELAE